MSIPNQPTLENPSLPVRSLPLVRCHWCNLRNPLYIDYHDHEWGVPVTDEGQLYELFLLETFQAGLSWQCVLGKREAFRRAFSSFDPVAIARYTVADVDRLMGDAGIIRNRRKIQAAVTNAQVFLDIQRERGSFLSYLQGFAGLETIYEVGPTRSALSDAISRDLARRGMHFVGSVTVYSYLQAVGIINGHESGCFLYSGPGRGE